MVTKVTRVQGKKKLKGKGNGRPLDPELEILLQFMDGLTPKEIAEKSGGWVGASTIRNWRAGKVRQPLNYTTSAALRACGYERVIQKISPTRKS